MKTTKRYVSATLGFVLLAAIMAFSLPQTGHSSFAAPPDKDVRVVNTAAEPVPVHIQGAPNVNVMNNPIVRAQQNGPWNVGVSGGVSVENSETVPLYIRDVDRPTARPFMREVVLNVPTGFGGENVDLGIVPGELVVIEQVSAFGVAPTSEVIEQFAILTRVPPDNTYRPHYLDFTSRPSVTGSNAYTVASQQVRIYAGPGSFARVARLGSAAPLTFRFILSGYYANE